MKCFVFEGKPVEQMKRGGWRHYMTLIAYDGGEKLKTHIGIGTSPRPILDSFKGAKFFPFGTWELCGDAYCPVHNLETSVKWASVDAFPPCPAYAVGFPAPRPEIVAELCRVEMAVAL